MSTPKKQKTFDTGTFYQAPVKVNRNTVTIELPKKVAEYFELDGPVVYWAPVGGVIQISGRQPHMVIPMMCINAGQFVPHKAAGDAPRATPRERNANMIERLLAELEEPVATDR